jgi:hypothetical protein
MMKADLLAAFTIAAIGCSAGHTNELAAAPRAQGAHFAAMSLINGQGLRAIVSNVLAPANGTRLAPCQIQVRFIGADGSLIGNATTIQLKAGESTSVPASEPAKLVRTVVSIGDDPAKTCALRTRVEIFDLETGMTFVSVTGESVDSNGEGSVSRAPSAGVARKNSSGRANSARVANSSPVSGGAASPKPRPPVLAATPPASQR